MIEKYKDGETLAEYRERKRSARRTGEAAVKKDLRVRDGIGCRWSGCDLWRRGFRIDAAHLDAKGIGGDKLLIRTVLENMMRICAPHHVGPVSLHSGDLRIEFLTERKANGPCAFWRRDPKAKDGWSLDGAEDEFTFMARRNEAATDSEDDDAEC
jgi:hypothetical protein